MAETPTHPNTQFLPNAIETQHRTQSATRTYARDALGNHISSTHLDPANPSFILHCATNARTHTVSAAEINREFFDTITTRGEAAIHRTPNVAQAMLEAAHFITNASGTRITPTPAHRPHYQPHHLCAQAEANGGLLKRPAYPQR